MIPTPPRSTLFPYKTLLRSPIVVLVACPMARADGERKGWNLEEARKYLDERQKAWFAFSSADRGEGETRTSCVRDRKSTRLNSSHTVISYAVFCLKKKKKKK